MRSVRNGTLRVASKGICAIYRNGVIGAIDCDITTTAGAPVVPALVAQGDARGRAYAVIGPKGSSSTGFGSTVNLPGFTDVAATIEHKQPKEKAAGGLYPAVTAASGVTTAGWWALQMEIKGV